MNETLKRNITIASKKAEKFMQSIWPLMIFPGAVLVFGILNYIAFGIFDNIEIYSPWVNSGSGEYGGIVSSDKEAWIGWLAITISTLGGVISIFGTLLVIRFDQRYLLPIIIGQSLIIIDSLIAGYLFTGMSYVVMLTTSIINWFQLKKVDDSNEEKNHNSMMNMMWWAIIGAVVIIYFLIGLTVLLAFEGDWSDETVWFNWIDIICSSIVVGSWFTMLRKDKLAFLGFLPTDLAYLISYFAMGYWATGISCFIYLFSDTVSMLSWISKDWKEN